MPREAINAVLVDATAGKPADESLITGAQRFPEAPP